MKKPIIWKDKTQAHVTIETKMKKQLFVPLDQEDFITGNHGASYLNEIIYQLIEEVNRLRREVNLLKRK